MFQYVWEDRACGGVPRNCHDRSMLKTSHVGQSFLLKILWTPYKGSGNPCVSGGKVGGNKDSLLALFV